MARTDWHLNREKGTYAVRALKMFMRASLVLSVAALLLSAVESKGEAQTQPVTQQLDNPDKNRAGTDEAWPMPIPKPGTIAQNAQSNATNYDPDCRIPKDHDQADLCIQRQIAEISQSALLWARWQTIIGAAGLFFVLLSLAFGAWAARAAALAAREASAGNKINRESLIIDQRAWVSIDLIPEGRMDISEYGGIYMPVKVLIKNIGKTPAQDIHTDVIMRCDTSYGEELNHLSELAGSQEDVDRRFCRSLLPDSSYARDWVASQDETGRQVNTGQILIPIVFVCVSYKTIFNDGVHQTAAAFTLGLNEGFDGYSPIPYTTSQRPASDVQVIPSGSSIIT